MLSPQAVPVGSYCGTHGKLETKAKADERNVALLRLDLNYYVHVADVWSRLVGDEL